MEQCYINGTGVAKNIPRAGQIDSYLMTHDDGQAVFKMIGADDENVQYRAERLKALFQFQKDDSSPEDSSLVPFRHVPRSTLILKIESYIELDSWSHL